MTDAVPMAVRKRVALIAHDNCKTDHLDWAQYNLGTLDQHDLFATGTTGAVLVSNQCPTGTTTRMPNRIAPAGPQRRDVTSLCAKPTSVLR
jgi:methylglyoxal synthase